MLDEDLIVEKQLSVDGSYVSLRRHYAAALDSLSPQFLRILLVFDLIL